MQIIIKALVENNKITFKYNNQDYSVKINTKQRTIKQNSALHLYMHQLGVALNDAGWDMKALLKKEVDIPWTTDTIKNFIWRPIQEAYLGKKSTTELTSGEIDKVYEVVNRHLAEKTGFSLPFPSEEVLREEN